MIRKRISQKTLQLIIHRLGNTKGMSAVTGPIPAFCFGQFSDALHQGCIRGASNIQCRPFGRGSIQFRHGAFSPVPVLFVIGECFVERCEGRIITLRYGHCVWQVIAVQLISHFLKHGPVVIG